jgi:hypothetical protein
VFDVEANTRQGLVGAGQKSGVSGRSAQPRRTRLEDAGRAGRLTGGLSATDGQRLFVAVANAGPTLAGDGAGALP